MVSDQRFDDFDAQSEQLSGHDQEYCQLSFGAFRGRFVSAFLDNGISLHLETANQALEQRIGCPKDAVSIGLVINGDRPFMVNGQELDQSGLFLTPPGAELSMFSPAGATILAICLEHKHVAQWSEGENLPSPIETTEGLCVQTAPSLADSLRTSAMRILRSGLTADRDGAEDLGGIPVGRHFISAVLSQLSLHQALAAWSRPEAADGSALFEQARTLLLEQPDGEIDYASLRARLGCSERTIQKAFSRHTDMSPTRYLRTVRLNRVRRMLLSRTHIDSSIGDLAARSGFWNWSRFSGFYKQQFDELPSETRLRLQ
ncbi:AraC family transcriptional regulator [Hoeflea poritis]|uniref:Helix-turn-helix domain-containing protein n=1 Tax=Hoeflea poritis TaxID=2993659 RepID=A0ABT4VHF9_9HYPH|nr:AraC family transcriptional regulator [Hoeflea poritis]MDA4844154.1 helix-turn-helix domain-containing protein [Hoeflea poritis]